MSYEFKVGDKGKCYSNGQYEVLAIRDGKLILWCEWDSHKITVMVHLDGTYLSNRKLQYIYPPKRKKWVVKYTINVGTDDEQTYNVTFSRESCARARYVNITSRSRHNPYTNQSIEEIEE